MDFSPTEQLIKSSGLVVFTGGSDVDPAMYGEPEHQATHSCIQRDIREGAVFQTCVDNRIPMVGICRGAQLLTVLAGGKLIQHVGGHSGCGEHKINIRDLAGVTKEYTVNSLHHQMMYPYNLQENNYALLGYSKGVGKIIEGFPSIETKLKHFSGVGAGMPLEPEIVLYPRIKALCFQFHPEMMSQDSEVVSVFQQMVAFYVMKHSASTLE